MSALAIIDRVCAIKADPGGGALAIAELPRARAAAVELIRTAKLVTDGAVPATQSGHTCFVPRYALDALRTAAQAMGETP